VVYLVVRILRSILKGAVLTLTVEVVTARQKVDAADNGKVQTTNLVGIRNTECFENTRYLQNLLYLQILARAQRN